MGAGIANSGPIKASKFGKRIVQQQDNKNSCQVAAPGNVVIATMGAGDSIDGVTLVEGMRVLLPNQTAQGENGAYDVGPAGGPSVRSSDWDEPSEISNGLNIIVVGGTNESGTYVVTTADPINIGDPVSIDKQPVGTHTHTLADITDSGDLAAKDEIANSDVAVAAAIAESKLALAFSTHTNANDPTVIEKVGLGRKFRAKVTGDYANIKLALDAYKALTGMFLADIIIDGDVDVGALAEFFRSVHFHGNLKDTADKPKIKFDATLQINPPTANDRLRFIFDNLHLITENNADNLRPLFDSLIEFNRCVLDAAFLASTVVQANSSSTPLTIICRDCTFDMGDVTNNIFSFGAQPITLILINWTEAVGISAGDLVTVSSTGTHKIIFLGGTKITSLKLNAFGALATIEVFRDATSEMAESLFIGAGTVTSVRVAGDQLRETSGPTLLDLGTIADGQHLKRSGTDLIGETLGSFRLLSSLAHSATTGQGENDHHAKVHALAGVEHNADTLSNLNSKISDATLDDKDDGRIPKDWLTAESNGLSSTTLAIFQDKVTLATGALTGVYRFFAIALLDNGGAVGEMRLWNDTDSVQVGGLNIFSGALSGERFSSVIVGEVTLAGVTKDIKIQWRDQASGNTQGIRNARIEMQRIS